MNGSRPLTDEETLKVFNELKSLRDRSIFVIGISCGLRISEILSLTVGDVMEYGVVGTQVRL